MVPCGTVNEIPSTARTSPNVFLTSRTARMSAMATFSPRHQRRASVLYGRVGVGVAELGVLRRRRGRRHRRNGDIVVR